MLICCTWTSIILRWIERFWSNCEGSGWLNCITMKARAGCSEPWTQSSPVALINPEQLWNGSCSRWLSYDMVLMSLQWVDLIWAEARLDDRCRARHADGEKESKMGVYWCFTFVLNPFEREPDAWFHRLYLRCSRNRFRTLVMWICRIRRTWRNDNHISLLFNHQYNVLFMNISLRAGLGELLFWNVFHHRL